MEPKNKISNPFYHQLVPHNPPNKPTKLDYYGYLVCQAIIYPLCVILFYILLTDPAISDLEKGIIAIVMLLFMMWYIGREILINIAAGYEIEFEDD
jgi:hypothetical protein